MRVCDKDRKEQKNKEAKYVQMYEDKAWKQMERCKR